MERFVRLLPFDDSQQQEFFRKAVKLEKEDYDMLKKSYQELLAKPLFAWMICLSYADTGHVANHPVIKKDWSKRKQNALIYLYFFAQVRERKYPDEKNNKRKWLRVLRAMAAFKHICKNDNSTFDNIPKKLKEVEIEIDNINWKDYLEPIIVKTQDENVNFAHDSFRDYLVATFYVESILLYSSRNSDNVNAKENYLKQYNLNIGFGIQDSSKIIDFLEGLLEIIDEPDIDTVAKEALTHTLDFVDSFGYNRKDIKAKIIANTKSILYSHNLLISDIRVL